MAADPSPPRPSPPHPSPSRTRAARLHEHGKPLEVDAVDLPAPGPDEELVTIVAAGINPVDRYTAEGKVSPDGPLPRTLGAEAAGRRSDGSRVMISGGGLGGTRDGVWAERAVVPLSSLVPIPDGVSDEVAASMGIAGLTAVAVVRHRARVTSRDRVLVLGAGGGVGLPIVSLAAAAGAEVLGQVGTPGKAEAVRDAGATDVVVADAAGLAEAVGDFAPTVVIDPLGGEFARAELGLIAGHGRVVVFGTSAGAEVTLDWQRIYRNNITVIGHSNFAYAADERATLVGEALAAAAEGLLRLPIDRTVELDGIDDAFGALVDRGVTGNIVLRIGASS